MEHAFKIKTSDGKKIYGVLTGSVSKPLIIIAHGLCGNMHEAMHYNAANFFARHGYSVFRFNFYSWQSDARKLQECSLATHGRDLDTVYQFFKTQSVRKIFLVGHSYGFPSILHMTKRDAHAIAAWDGSYLPHNFFMSLESDPTQTYKLLDEGYMCILGTEMVSESQNFSSLDSLKSFSTPIIFITTPGKKSSTNFFVGKKMFASYRAQKKFVVVPGAGHNFYEEGAQQKLFTETLNWFDSLNS